MGNIVISTSIYLVEQQRRSSRREMANQMVSPMRKKMTIPRKKMTKSKKLISYLRSNLPYVITDAFREQVLTRSLLACNGGKPVTLRHECHAQRGGCAQFQMLGGLS